MQQVQPSQVSTCGMLCCRELWGILALRVPACSAAGCGSVSTRGDLSLHVFWGKEEIHITHLCNALLKKHPLLAFRRARKGLIRSCKHLHCTINKGCFKFKVVSGCLGYCSVASLNLLQMFLG